MCSSFVCCSLLLGFVLTTFCGRVLCDSIGDLNQINNNENNNNNNVKYSFSGRNFGETAAISNTNATKLYPDRYARLLNLNGHQVTAMKSVEDNEIDDDMQDVQVEDPSAPLYGIYNECLFRLSYQCVQRKLLVFLDRLSRLQSFRVVGNMLTVVRTKQEMGPVIKESDLQARLNTGDASTALSSLIEYNLEQFIQNHVLRVTLPAGITASVSNNARSSSALTGDTIDINLTRALEETTGRGKGDKKMKKIMGMMMAGVMGKLAFMGPFLLMIIKLKAIKALILSKIALALSLFQLLKSGGMKGGGGGGGGGGHGKEVIIVHDSHGGGGHESLGSSGWATGGGGGGGGGGWISGGDSYSQGPHTGGGDATYAGSDQTYATGTQTGGWGNSGSSAGHGWVRRSSGDPHIVAYRAYIPDAE